MKKIALVFISLFCISHAYSQRYNLKHFQLKGPILKIVELEFESDELYSKKELLTFDTILFRTDGSLKSHKGYRANGELLAEEKTTYNDDKKIILYSKFHIVQDSIYEIFKYDDSRNIVTSYLYKSEKLSRVTQKKYDSLNNMIAIQFMNSDSILRLETSHKYDQNQKRVSSYSFNCLNGAETFTEYEYNKLGQISKFYEYGPTKNKITTEEYKFDNMGNQIEFKRCYNNGSEKINKTKYIYHNSHFEGIGYTHEGRKESYYKYDMKGNVLEKVFFNREGKIRGKSIYELDKYGNWVKEICEVDDEFIIYIRTIEYYSE